MALRRGIGSLSAVLNSLRQLALPEASSAACAHHQHAAPTLVSLRSFWLASGSPTCPPSVAAAPVLASGCRQFSGASPSWQQAAAAAAAAPAAAAGEQEETLEQIRARIFGTHIGGERWCWTLFLLIMLHAAAGAVCPAPAAVYLGQPSCLPRTHCVHQADTADPPCLHPHHCTALRRVQATGSGRGARCCARRLWGRSLWTTTRPTPSRLTPSCSTSRQSSEWPATQRWQAASDDVLCCAAGELARGHAAGSTGDQHATAPRPRPCLPAPPRSAKLKLDRLRRRGKAPPKKGAGKRAGKKR